MNFCAKNINFSVIITPLQKNLLRTKPGYEATWVIMFLQFMILENLVAGT